MLVAEIIEQARDWERAAHVAGQTIAFVPTMGALHEGHRALIRRAGEIANAVAVSIFVNPTQFGPGEDLESYPRDLEADLKLCRDEGVALAFTPMPETIYPEGDRTVVEVTGLSEVAEGASRPNHFRGVTTVVLKLFAIIQPDVALFGWKDAQQLLIIRRMVADLHLPLHIEPVETVREPDGLALSSRNRRLSPEARAAAPVLHRALQAGLQRVIAGARTAEAVRDAVLQELKAEPSVTLDRLDLLHLDTLKPLDRVSPGKTLLALAAHVGGVRLIDNLRA
jgi:pantoate--beta-alanine ligase